ncbi:MAG TPA: hypothetical protein VGZ90_19815 [Puia sp.]|jgi:hypothetical protein|nr:hypothetical protein [Puia sp.]
MAKVRSNIILQNLSGTVGKKLVFKIINGETFATKYPDRSKVKYNKEQLQYREIFAKASKYASEIVNDPVKKKAYKVKGRTSVYHAAIKNYMAAYKKQKK